MAPKKRTRSNTDENPPFTSSRVTRSSTNSNAAPKTTAPTPPAKKKAKTQVKKAVKAEVKMPIKSTDSCSKTVVIEHCKQCDQFKTRAIKVKDALENDISGINVLVNPEKPRRGCFEVREEGGEIFISLLDMKRPFQPMRALDMDQVISDIIEKLKKGMPAV